MKSEKGSVVMAIFVAMLIFAIYGIIFYSNSASAYIRQTRAIEAIQKVYSKDIDNAYKIHDTLE